MNTEIEPSSKGKKVIELKDILDIKAIQALMDDFYMLTNIGVAIIDLHGEVLVATGWQDVCTRFHRINCITKQNCIESDTFLSRNVKEGEYLEYKCKNNMWDIATPIFVSSQHVGNLFLGQFFYVDEVIDIKVFEEQAERYGFDKENYMDALRRVPKWSRTKVKTVMSLYSKFAGIISKLLTSNLSSGTLLEENKKTIQELKISNTDLEQFAHVISHDLKEPLRMVSIYAGILSKRYKGNLDNSADEYISYIVNGVKRMHSLITDLMKYSQINPESKSIELVDCNQIINEVKLDLKLIIEEKDAEFHCNPLPELVAKPTQIKQLFQNLIENAIKFNNKSKPEILISSIQQGGEWLFSVEDNGIGIAPEYHKKIFTLFQRLHGDNTFPGTGAGLAISKRIVEQNGGQIWVESEPGKGSTFYFTFPAI